MLDDPLIQWLVGQFALAVVALYLLDRSYRRALSTMEEAYRAHSAESTVLVETLQRQVETLERQVVQERMRHLQGIEADRN